MKQITLLLIASVITLCSMAQNNVGIGTTTPDASSKLEISSDNAGLLIPRLTTAQRIAISNPANGLLVFDTDSATFAYRTGSIWLFLRGTESKANDWSTTGNAGSNTDNFIGTTDTQPLHFKINNENAGEIDSLGYNTGFGFRVFDAITTGQFNTALGYKAFVNNAAGGYNTAIGSNSLRFNTTGNGNTSAGHQTIYSNTTGSFNTAIGYQAMYTNTTGEGNTALGTSALSSNTYGSSNTANGYLSLYYNTTGGGNTSAGHQSLFLNTTGYSNTANGYYALYNNTTGTSNTALGYHADVSSGNLTNATAIGNGAVVNADNKIRLGNSSVTVIEGQVPFTSPSDGRFKTNIIENVKGLDFIMKLRPVIYNFQAGKYDAFIKTGKLSDAAFASYTDFLESEKIRHNGFIAQEVEKAAKQTGYDFDGVIAPKNSKDAYGLSYSQFVVPLVKAVQEQQQIIQKQQQQIDAFAKEMQLLKEKIK